MKFALTASLFLASVSAFAATGQSSTAPDQREGLLALRVTGDSAKAIYMQMSDKTPETEGAAGSTYFTKYGETWRCTRRYSNLEKVDLSYFCESSIEKNGEAVAPMGE
jgi:hypothetical protein